MSSSNLIRWSGSAAMIGGVVWVVTTFLTLAMPKSVWTDVLFIIALLSVVAGFVGFHALQKTNYRRIGRSGFWMVVAASLAQVVGLIFLLLGSTALEWLVFPAGALAVTIGFVLYGYATLQARVLPVWCAIGFVVSPVTFMMGAFGGILFGLLWLALGYMLWSQKDTSV